MKAARNFAIIALLALAVVAIPGGGTGLNVVLSVLAIAFFVAIALFGYRLYREHRMDIETLADRLRLVLYASVGLAFLTFAATPRLFDHGAGGVLIWLALLGLCSYGVIWVVLRTRRYD